MASVTKRGDAYRIRVSCGYDVSGRQIMKSTTWKPAPGLTERQIEKELNRQATLFEERCLSGQVLDSTMKFQEFSDLWFTRYAEKQLKPKTVARYHDLMRRILPAIGHLRLDKIQPHHLLAFYDNLAESGVKDNTKYKPVDGLPALLKESHMTQTALSRDAGVSIATVKAVAQGKNVNKASAERISAALSGTMQDYFSPVEGDARLSSKTVLHYHRLTSSILGTAVEWQVLFSNPCDRVKPPRVEKSAPRYLDEKEAGQLLDALEGENYQFQVAVKLLIYTGFRRGELCGLEWPDIDFHNRVIHIRRESLYLPEKGVFVDDGKTDTSIRSIKVAATVVSMLKEYKAWQHGQRFKLGDRWKESGRLFTTTTGTPIHPDTLSGWFKDFIAKSNLPDISLHSLRHTNATLLIASGTALTTVAKRLGHANVATTSKVYAHAIRSADEAAAETVENLLTPTHKGQAKSG